MHKAKTSTTPRKGFAGSEYEQVGYERYEQGHKETQPEKRQKTDGKFKSKNIKHDPNAEGARAVFGLKDDEDGQ
jgi:hypothetical protein